MLGKWSPVHHYLAATAAVWNDAGIVVTDPFTQGAFGAVFAIGLPKSETNLLGDFSGDGCVNEHDFQMFVSGWLGVNCLEPNRCGGLDLNMNGKVDEADFSILSSNWGLCNPIP